MLVKDPTEETSFVGVGKKLLYSLFATSKNSREVIAMYLSRLLARRALLETNLVNSRVALLSLLGESFEYDRCLDVGALEERTCLFARMLPWQTRFLVRDILLGDSCSKLHVSVDLDRMGSL